MKRFKRYKPGKEPVSAEDLNDRATWLEALVNMKVASPLEMIVNSGAFVLRLAPWFGVAQKYVMFAVRVTIDGGAAGDNVTTCSWTYTVEDLDGNELGTSMEPTKRRMANIVYTSTPAGSIGSAFYDENGDLELFDANEEPDTDEEC